MSFQNLSYFTKISILGRFLNYYETSSFVVNGISYSGVIIVGSGSDFLVDQTPTYHRIKVDQNRYITSVPYSSNLPADVRQYLSPNISRFFTTSDVESRFYFVTSLATPTASTVNLYNTTTNFYICIASSNQFMSIIGNQLAVQQNNGYFAAMQNINANNVYFGPGSSSGGVPTDSQGNETLFTNGTVADFTATPLGPVLGAYDTGVLVPGYARTNAFTVGVPGKQMRYLPYGNIITPDISQNSVGSRGLFGNGGVFTTTGTAGAFGKAITVTDYISAFAVSAPVATTGYIDILGLDPVPPLVQRINSAAGETIGEGLLFNTDGSVLIFSSRTAAGSTIKIYNQITHHVWTQSTAPLPVIAGDTTLGCSVARIGMSKDGRTIVANTFPAKGLFIYEDTSVPGDWSSFHVNDLTADIAGLSVRAVCISPEGTWVWAIVESAPAVFNTFALFKRHAYNNWTKTYESNLLGPYPGNDASIIRTGYNGLFTMVTDFSLIAADPGCNGTSAIARLSNTVLIYVPIRGTPMTSAATSVANNSNMTLITVLNNTDTIMNLGRISSIIQAPVDQVVPGGLSLESCTFADSNFGSIGFFGDVSTGTVYIITTSNNPMNLFFSAEHFDFQSFNSGLKMLSITSDSGGGTTNVNPGSPSSTDLGAPAARWKDIYLSSNLFLPTNTVNGAFEGDGNGTLQLQSTAGPANIATVTNGPINWYRTGRTVNIIGKIIYNTPVLPVGSEELRIVSTTPLPAILYPGLHDVIIGQITTSAGGLLPTTYPMYIEMIAADTFGIYTTDATGVKLPFRCGTLDVAPPILGVAGEIKFSITYQVNIS